MVGARRNPFLLLVECRILRGRERNNLLVHAWRTNSLFFLFLSLFLFFLLSFLSFLFPCFPFFGLSQVVVTVILALFSPFSFPSFVHGKGLLLQRLPWPDFIVLALNHLCLVQVYLPTTIGPSVCHSPSPDKENYFVCQSTMTPLPATMWFLSLYPSWHALSGSNSALPFWVVCHPSRTLPPKEPWQKRQNRFSPLLTTKPCPLTFDP